MRMGKVERAEVSAEERKEGSKGREDQERIALYTKSGQERRVMDVHAEDGRRYFK